MVSTSKRALITAGCAALAAGSLLTVPSEGAGAVAPLAAAMNCGAPADTVAPRIVSLHVSPSTVSVQRHSAVVHVTAHVTDTMAGADGTAVPGSGARKVGVDLFGARYALEEGALHLASGTPQDGIWRGRVRIHKHEDASTWDVGEVSAKDVAGNEADYSGIAGTRPSEPNDVTIQPGWDTTIVVHGTPRPETRVHLESFSVHPLAVDATRAPAHLTVSARIRGPVEPPRTLSVSFDRPRTSGAFAAWLRHRKGDRYTARVTVPRWIGSGTFRPSIDANYFWDSFDGRVVKGRRITARVHVTAGNDTTAPRLTALSLSPHHVDTTGSPERITVRASLQDAESGVASGGYFVLQSSGGRHDVLLNLHRHRSTWVGSALVPRCVGSATWHLSADSLSDRTDNFRDYSSRQLRAAGFPDSVAVVSDSGDTSAPVIANDGEPVSDGLIPLDFSEPVRNVTMSNLSVYQVNGRGSGDFAHPLMIQSVTCSDGSGPVDCSGSGGPVRSAQLAVAGMRPNRSYEVWANQDSVVPQVTDRAGNPMDWSLFVAHYFSQ
jgi:hypothetical protein